MKDYEVLKLKNQLCFPIYLCSKEIIRKYSQMLNKLDLTYTQYIVMLYFWEIKESNVKCLGNALLLDSSTLTPLLIKLENKGYIVRKKDKNDNRNLVLKLTKNGDELKDKAIDIPRKMAEYLNLNNEEVELLYRLLYKILTNIEKEND